MKIRFRSKTTGKWAKSATWGSHGATVTSWTGEKADALVFEGGSGGGAVAIGWLALDPDLRMVRAAARRVVKGHVCVPTNGTPGRWILINGNEAALAVDAAVEVRLARKGA